MRNNLAMATEQDNKALQENVDRQNELVMALRQRVEAQKELLNLSDADIQAAVGLEPFLRNTTGLLYLRISAKSG